MKTPTIEEVLNAAKKYEESTKCKDCIVYRECAGGLHYGTCKAMFLSAVVAGEINLDGTPVHGEKPEPTKPALPKWCKVGAWVLSKHKNHLSPSLWRVTKIDGYNVEAYDGKSFTRRGHFQNFSPARFRLPTLAEAYEWLGKVMEFKDGTRELVHLVGEDEVTGEDMGTERMLFVNRKPAECLQSCTIDGHPFGVPVVDTDAEAQA